MNTNNKNYTIIANLASIESEFENNKPYSDHRHSNGEYFTPFWLAKEITNKSISYWLNMNLNYKAITMVDPACGNGVFLAAFIKSIKENNIKIDKLKIIGVDINSESLKLAEELLKKYSMYLNMDNILFEYKNTDFLDEKSIKADFIIGNPPWVVLRNIRGADYQEQVKLFMRKYNLWGAESHLITQLDLAALFYIKSFKDHLNHKGIISFIMPGSIYPPTSQYKNFWKVLKGFSKENVIWNLEDIMDLFPVPSRVLFTKNGITKEKLEMFTVVKKEGNIELHNNPMKNEEYFKIKSHYYPSFKVGASIFPRSFYIVDINSRNNGNLSIVTKEDIIKKAKQPWDIRVAGDIDESFIYNTIIANDIIPFGILKTTKVPLPIVNKGKCVSFIEIPDINSSSHDWFTKCNNLWIENSTKKSKKRFPSLWDRLNYNNLLVKQYPFKRYVVLYTATGSNITCTMIDRHELNRFIVDVKTWYFQTNNKNEAFYLVCILNSNLVNSLIKYKQPKGLYGARAIHRIPLELNIPKYNINSNEHKEIVEISKNLSLVVHKFKKLRKPSRSAIRRNFSKEYDKIDLITKSIISNEVMKCQQQTLFQLD